MGLCVLACVVTPAAAHELQRPSFGGGAPVAHHAASVKHDRQVVAFFAKHRWLLSDPRFAREAKRELSSHRRRLAVAQRRLAQARSVQATRESRAHNRERVRRLAVAATPRAVICRVFGPYCEEAVRVAHCESRLTIDAQNGQYLGLFQMGSTARRLFGHGDSAEEQARAALRFFVRSGSDWGPWTCKPL